MSTGVGPMSYYTSLGSGRRRSSGRSSVADYEAEIRRAQRSERLDDVQRLHDQFVHHLRAHLEAFPPIEKPTATPERIDVEQRVTTARRDSARGISVLHPGRRRVARDAAEEAAREQASIDQEAATVRVVEQQAAIDTSWELLLANDPNTVLDTIEGAFADSEAPAAPLDADDETRSVTLLMRFPAVAAIVPTHTPDTTPTGRPTMRGYSKTDRSGLYLAAMMSHVHATVAEAFAVAPAMTTATILVVVSDTTTVTPVYVAEVERAAFNAGAWLSDGRRPTLAPGCLINLRGRTNEPAPLDLTAEPELSETILRIADEMQLEIDPGTRLARPPKTPAPGRTHPAAPQAPSEGEPGIQKASPATVDAIPQRITQAWITATVPTMPDAQYQSLVGLLLERGWTEEEITDRVAFLRGDH